MLLCTHFPQCTSVRAFGKLFLETARSAILRKGTARQVPNPPIIDRAVNNGYRNLLIEFMPYIFLIHFKYADFKNRCYMG